jgi:hypothetical protein
MALMQLTRARGEDAAAQADALRGRTTLLKAELHNKRGLYAQISSRVAALVKASQESDNKRRISNITLQARPCQTRIPNLVPTPVHFASTPVPLCAAPEPSRYRCGTGPGTLSAGAARRTRTATHSRGSRYAGSDTPRHATRPRARAAPLRVGASGRASGNLSSALTLFTQFHDLRLGVPVEYHFRLAFFTVESQVSTRVSLPARRPLWLNGLVASVSGRRR